MLKVAPGTDYTVRIVRTAKGPVAGEESYRLLIDQLPEPKDRKANQVSLVIRHSIPVFFRGGRCTSSRAQLERLHHKERALAHRAQ
jgi:fimbrial chaperone protein